MNGQQYFQKPSADQIAVWIDRKAAGMHCKRVWVGPKTARDVFNQAVSGEIQKENAIKQIQEQWEGYNHLFAAPEDGSVHAWLQELAGYSPIVHLQQSDGQSSPHWSFSPEYNENGIIRAEEILRSIAKAYARGALEGLPQLCSHIMLTLEPFIGTAGNNYDALEEIEQSILYWRQYLPHDGMLLSEVLKIGSVGSNSR
jgi:hypothetical protein